MGTIEDKLQLALSTKERIREQLIAKGRVVPQGAPFSMYPDIIEFGDFDQAWTISGKSNSDPDRDIIKNLTGNGNDLQLVNFDFTENSGYNSEGYLVTDGVDDRIISSKFQLGEKYTIIGDWHFLRDEVYSAGIVKNPQIFIYNRKNNEIRIEINSVGINNIISAKGLKAVCSDGRVYDQDWNEIPIKVGTNTSGDILQIGCLDVTEYVAIAFKNIAIYYDRWFTKEQCIAAYNYLQSI